MKYEGKTAEEFLEKGMKFYSFKMVILTVEVTEIEFVDFLDNNGHKIPIFSNETGTEFKSIPYFWRDFCLVNSYQDGWYLNRDQCIEAGKKFYIQYINKSK